jgi:hypothetical protein
MRTIATLVVALLVGAGAGWWFSRPAAIVETAKPAETQKDGSKIAEVAPDAKAKPKHMTPKGAKVERIGQVVAQGETPPEIAACTATRCPPVTIDTSLVRLPDGSRRVIVSSPDGQVLKGVDIPVETAAPPPEPPKWAMGISIDPIRQTPGIWVERDLWRIRLGAEINQTRLKVGGPSAPELRVRLGWTF